MPPMHTADAPEVSVAVFDEGRITLEHRRLPARDSGQIDVAISVAAICGSDLHTVLGHRVSPPRTALGHEAVGVVESVDDGTTDLRGAPLRPGDRVVFSMISACGKCDRCRRGLTMKCRSVMKYGHESVDLAPHATGMLADRIRLTPRVPVLRLPEDIADSVMVSAGCAVATAAAVVEAADPAIGDDVVVFGAGAVGFYCAAMLASLGCTVRVREPSERRLAALAGTGAVPDDGALRSFPVVVEAAGHPDAFGDALNVADVGGHVIGAGAVSVGSSTLSVDPAVLVTRRTRFSGIHNYTEENFRWGVDWLLAHGRQLDLDQLISPARPLSAIESAFDEMRTGTYARVVVQPEGHGQTSR